MVKEELQKIAPIEKTMNIYIKRNFAYYVNQATIDDSYANILPYFMNLINCFRLKQQPREPFEGTKRVILID